MRACVAFRAPYLIFTRGPQGELRQLLRKLPPRIQAALALATMQSGVDGQLSGGSRDAVRAVRLDVLGDGRGATSEVKSDAAALSAQVSAFRASTGCAADTLSLQQICSRQRPRRREL